jgi:hypothetical protein
MCMFCRSLFVLLCFFSWPVCCLYFELQILITPLVSSNSSYKSDYYTERKGTHFNFHGDPLVSSNSSYKSDYYTERKGTHFNFHGDPLVSSNSSYKSDSYTERKGTHFNFHGENLEVLKKKPTVYMLWRNKIPENISKSAAL